MGRSASRTKGSRGDVRLSFAAAVLEQIALQGLRQAELSRRLGVTPPYITKILRGDANLTAREMARIGRALGCTVRVRFESR